MWRYRGTIAWKQLNVIGVMLLTMAVAATYLLLRLSLWRPLAVAGTVFMMLSMCLVVNPANSLSIKITRGMDLYANSSWKCNT